MQKGGSLVAKIKVNEEERQDEKWRIDPISQTDT